MVTFFIATFFVATGVTGSPFQRDHRDPGTTLV